MIFGVRDVRQELGGYSGDNCEACTEGYIYRLVRITRFLVVFFINLIPLGSRYEAVCDSCEAALEVDKTEGRRIAKAEFGKRITALNTVTVLRLCVCILLLAAAVALPLTLIKPAPPGPQLLKDMVTEDGIFTIQDSDGQVLGIIDQTDGQKTLTFYEKTSRLTGEPGADGSFIRREYYMESQSGTFEVNSVMLERVADNPGMLEDRYGMAVRIYHYDAATQTLSFARGIADLTSIVYQKNRVEYPFVYYAADGTAQDVFTVLLIEPDSQIEATFVPSDDGTDQLAIIIVRQFEHGRVSTESMYQLAVSAAAQQGISRTSTAGDIKTFIESAGLTPSNVLAYNYFGNTKVYTSVELSIPDAAGSMQTITQPFEVVKKDGFYIQRIQDAE